MGMIIKELGTFKIKGDNGTIELNFGDSIHFHVSGTKITMYKSEFIKFANILKESIIVLNRNKNG